MSYNNPIITFTFFQRFPDQTADRINTRYHRQDGGIHPGKIILTCRLIVIVWHCIDLDTRDRARDRVDIVRLEMRTNERKNKVRKLCDTWADKDETGNESREWELFIQAQGGQRIDGRSNQSKDHQKASFTPRNIEQPAHGWSEAAQVFFNDMNLQTGDRENE